MRRSALGLITSLAVMAGCARKPAAPRSALPLAEAPAPTMTSTASSDPPRPPPPGHIANAEEAAKLMALFTPTAGDSGTAAEPVVWSRLEPEHIKRVIRGSFPKFRQCYEVALAQYPAMKPHGTVRSRYIIGPDGFIEIVHSVAGDPSLPPTMIECISREHLYLHFDQPTPPGKVLVTYPIDFQNEE